MSEFYINLLIYQQMSAKTKDPMSENKQVLIKNLQLCEPESPLSAVLLTK